MPSGYLFEGEEHAALRAQIRRFATTEIAPHAAAWEEAEEFPRELYRLAAEAGVFGIGYPEEAGGTGGDITHVLVAADEVVVSGRSVGTAAGLGSHGIAMPPLVRFDGPTQVAPDSETTYTFVVSSQMTADQTHAGFNVAASGERLEEFQAVARPILESLKLKEPKALFGAAPAAKSAAAKPTTPAKKR